MYSIRILTCLIVAGTLMISCTSDVDVYSLTASTTSGVQGTCLKLPVSERFPEGATYFRLQLESDHYRNLKQSIHGNKVREELESISYYLNYEFRRDCQMITGMGDTLHPILVEHEQLVAETPWNQFLIAFESPPTEEYEVRIESPLYHTVSFLR